MKIISTLADRRSTNLLVISILILSQLSCGQASNKKAKSSAGQFAAMTLEVEISNKNCLAILLANDGTINRSGSGIVDTTDKNFFMGRTEDKPFDKLMATVSDDLLSFCEKTPPKCDTLKQTYKVKASFSGSSGDTGFEYCINGTANDLPAPIKEYITHAIDITDPWYQAQMKMINKK